MKPKKARCFASGGKIDPEQLLRDMQSKYGVSATPKEPEPQAPPPPPVVATTQKPQGGGLLGQAIGSYGGRSAKIEKEVGYANGGKIKGPGTSISDSIPARVRETGENIQVSNKERIVSAAQDKVLERIAEMLGYGSVDEMFAVMTNKPVGPTIKVGKKKAFATGGALDEYGNDMTRANAMGAAADKMRNDRLASATPVSPITSGLQSTRVGAVTQNNLQKDPLKTLTNQVDMGNAVENSNLTMTEKSALGMGTSAAAASDMRKRTDALTSLRDGIAAQQQPNTGSAWVGGGNGDPLNSTWMRSFRFGGKPDTEGLKEYWEENSGQPKPNPSQPVPVDNQIASDREAGAKILSGAADAISLPGRAIHDVGVGVNNAVSRTRNAIAGKPVAPILDYSIGTLGVTPFSDMVPSSKAQPSAQTPKLNSPIAQGLQERTFSQPVQSIAELPEKTANPIRDGADTPAYTGIDGKPTGNWYDTQRYKDQIAVNDRMSRLANQMERDRLKRDMGADITNPNVKESARTQLAALDSGQAADLREKTTNQSLLVSGLDQQSKQNALVQQRQLQDLYSSYSNEPDATKKQKIADEIAIRTGKDRQDWKAVHAAGGTDPSDPLGVRKLPDQVILYDGKGNVRQMGPGQNQVANALPSIETREIGKKYTTPKGSFIWRGNGWEAA